MTADLLKQWNDYACIPRCIIKLTELNGQPITRDEFCSRFGHLFSNPAAQYGLFPTHYIQAVLKPLSLPQKVSESGDYSTVESALANGQLALMFSHVDLNPGGTGVLHHCSVLTKMGANGFSIWTPCQNGADIAVSFTKADWTGKQCSGFILA